MARPAHRFDGMEPSLQNELIDLVHSVRRTPWPTDRGSYQDFAAEVGLPNEGALIETVSALHRGNLGFRAQVAQGTIMWVFGLDALTFLRIRKEATPSEAPLLKRQAVELRSALQEIGVPTGQSDHPTGFTSYWDDTKPGMVLNWFEPGEDPLTAPGSMELTFHTKPSEETGQ